MLERLLDIELSEENGTVTEEVELICRMTGFRRRFSVHHIGGGGLPLRRADTKLGRPILRL